MRRVFGVLAPPIFEVERNLLRDERFGGEMALQVRFWGYDENGILWVVCDGDIRDLYHQHP